MEVTHITINFVLAVTALFSIILIVIKGTARFAAIETKVDTMWAFQMRRAMTEVISAGVGSVNSPIKFTNMAIETLTPIKDELIAFWDIMPKPIDDLSALLLIERRFGEQLVRLVCIPCGLSHGACLLLALSIAKKSGEISFID